MSSKNTLTRHPVRAGLTLLALAAVAVLLVFNKPSIVTWLTPGETITVELARDYKIQPNLSTVKIAGAKIGVVQSVELQKNGLVRMILKVNRGTRALLGTEPIAVVQPTTLLGGTYFIQLHPGGQPGEAPTDVIPVRRTGLPVELQQILSAIPPDAQTGTQVALAKLDDTFRPGGVSDSLNTLLADAPSGLKPTAVVLDAARGVNKDADLSNLVRDLNTTAHTLTATPGQLRSLVDSTAATSRAFGDNAAAVDKTIATLPVTLRTSRQGAGDLARLLDKLTATADDVRPTVRELDPTLRKLRPALGELRPVLDDLQPLLEDAEPLLNRLTPALDHTTDITEDLDGPVLHRLNGPILDAFLSEWKGYAPKYPQGGDPGAKMYQELAYVVTNADGATQFFNASQHILAVWLGAGPTMLQGTTPFGQAIQDYLSEATGPPHHQQPTPIGPPLHDGIPLPGPDKKGPSVPAPNSGHGSPLKHLLGAGQ